jgi:nicotinate-nucleotide adenylyltransferase
MAGLAVEFYNSTTNSNLKCSDVEFNLPKPSWTDDSIRAIKEELNDPNLESHELHIICGRDTHHRVQSWKNKNYIIDNCKFLVFDRAGYDPVEDKKLHAKSKYVTDFNILPISSTLVREKLNKGGEIHELVPDVINLYIRQNNLYK